MKMGQVITCLLMNRPFLWRSRNLDWKRDDNKIHNQKILLIQSDMSTVSSHSMSTRRNVFDVTTVV